MKASASEEPNVQPDNGVPHDEIWEIMWCYVGWFEVADR